MYRVNGSLASDDRQEAYSEADPEPEVIRAVLALVRLKFDRVLAIVIAYLAMWTFSMYVGRRHLGSR